MGKSYKELKAKIHDLTMLCVAKDIKIKRLELELLYRDSTIVEMSQEIELLKNGLPFLKDVKQSLIPIL